MIRILTLLAILGTCVACSTTVAPIDLQNKVVPLEARKFVADAQDAVSIEKARVDDARRDYEQTKVWHRSVLRNNPFAHQAALAAELERVVNARLALAALTLERAEAEHALANAKLDLVTAQTAIRNDLAIYDLEPLIARTEEARTFAQALSKEIEQKRREMDAITTQWWNAYAQSAQAGQSTKPFFIAHD